MAQFFNISGELTQELLAEGNGVKVNKEYFETQTIALHKDSKFKSIFNNKR